jgi:AraC-like DNA-binding protein
MKTPILIPSVTEFNKGKEIETRHPLISVFKQEDSKPITPNHYQTGLYLIFLKDSPCAELIYGRKTYDYQEGTLVFMEPGQHFGLEYQNLPPVKPNGWGIAFHKDLLKGTALAQKIKEYHFFSYAVHEALHISQKERATVLEMIQTLYLELQQYTDKHSKEIIISHLELLLKYFKRFYERQFQTREIEYQLLEDKINTLLEHYLLDRLAEKQGPPSVRYCAEKMHLSPNYFGDLVKQQLGKNPQDIIQNFLITEAKKLLQQEQKSIKEISLSLGFEYPNHFSRFFKNKTGSTPSDFRS